MMWFKCVENVNQETPPPMQAVGGCLLYQLKNILSKRSFWYMSHKELSPKYISPGALSLFQQSCSLILIFPNFAELQLRSSECKLKWNIFRSEIIADCLDSSMIQNAFTCLWEAYFMILNGSPPTNEAQSSSKREKDMNFNRKLSSYLVEEASNCKLYWNAKLRNQETRCADEIMKASPKWKSSFGVMIRTAKTRRAVLYSYMYIEEYLFCVPRHLEWIVHVIKRDQ